MENNLLFLTYNNFNIYLNNKRISVNDMFCVTKNREIFEKYCTLYSNLEIILKNITKNENLIENNSIDLALFFPETFLGFYLVELCKISILEEYIPVGLVREDYIHFQDSKNTTKKIPLNTFLENLMEKK